TIFLYQFLSLSWGGERVPNIKNIWLVVLAATVLYGFELFSGGGIRRIHEDINAIFFFKFFKVALVVRPSLWVCDESHFARLLSQRNNFIQIRTDSACIGGLTGCTATSYEKGAGEKSRGAESNRAP